MRPSRWTPEQDAWLREHYPRECADDLRAGFMAEFGIDRGETGIRSRAKVLGLGKADGYKAPHPRAWSAERAEWFASFVPGHTEAEISAEHERLFGFPLTEGQIGNAKTRYKVKSGTTGGRFVKGQVSPNKGKRQTEFMSPEAIERTKATRFKKGEVHDRPDGWLKPVGHERVDNKDGYVWVKVRDSRTDGIQHQRPGHFNENYRLKHHVVWEQHNGQPVPPHTMIVFADRDKRNFDPGNLVAVPRRLWVRISQLKMEYCDRETLEACMLRAELHARMGELRRA